LPIDGRAVAVVVAHPDDEVIGAGSRLPLLSNVSVVHVTDGAPHSMQDALAAGYLTREAYASARRREAEAALALAGIPSRNLYALGLVDQEASSHLAELARRLVCFMSEKAIRVVLTHAYEGGHPDHDATAFAVHSACALIVGAGGGAPAVIEMAGYHAGPQGLVTHRFLPEGEPGLTVGLNEMQRALKHRMLACHTSQARTLAEFGLEVERYRPASRYDFGAPPHPGTLWYEQFDWGITAARWRTLASEALAELGLQHRYYPA
jgi:LmbE family N-acetylglucosaminyl deacetylase